MDRPARGQRAGRAGQLNGMLIDGIRGTQPRREKRETQDRRLS